MRYKSEHKEATRRRIVKTAARRFREHGFAGIGIADLMADAGLTHGGFYAHFPNKDALAATATAEALKELPQLIAWSRERGRDPVEELIDRYLTAVHRDTPGAGCAIAALGAEAPRQGPGTQASFAAAIEAGLDALGGLLPGGRDEALALLAALVGGLVMARAVGTGALSEAILSGLRSILSARHRSGHGA